MSVNVDRSVFIILSGVEDEFFIAIAEDVTRGYFTPFFLAADEIKVERGVGFKGLFSESWGHRKLSVKLRHKSLFEVFVGLRDCGDLMKTKLGNEPVLKG